MSYLLKHFSVRRDSDHRIHIQRSDQVLRGKQADTAFAFVALAMLAFFYLLVIRAQLADNNILFVLISCPLFLVFFSVLIWGGIEQLDIAQRKHWNVYTFDPINETFSLNGVKRLSFELIRRVVVRQERRGSGEHQSVVYSLKLQGSSNLYTTLDEGSSRFDMLCSADMIAGIIGCPLHYEPLP